MNIHAGDIISYNSKMLVSKHFLLNNTDVKEPYLRVAKSRAKGIDSRSWAHELIQENCFFIYEHIPGRYREQLPEPETLRSYAVRPVNEITSLVDECMSNGYKLFLSTYNTFTGDRQKALCQSASIIHDAKNFVEINALSWSKSAFFERLADEIALQEVKYLPKSANFLI